MIIEKMNGEVIDTKDTPLQLLTLWRESVEHRTETQQLPGADGLIHVETTYGARRLVGTFFFDSRDIYDYYLILNEIYKLFASKKPFYLTHSEREPGKRWLLQAQNTYTPEKIGHVGTFEIEFLSYSPFSESVGTTQDDFTFDSELWMIGMGLQAEDYTYTHTTNDFVIHNPGDREINPRETPLVIEVTANEAGTGMTITNNTTGDEWSYTGTINPGDVIKLDGIKSYRNGLSIFRDTNRKLITLAEGENDITISGLTDFEVSFDFRFYYL